MSVRAEVIRCDSRGSLRCGFSSTSGIWARPGLRGGFGKSVLLDAADERAVREGFAVLGARGHASEADLAWSAATEALGDLVAGGHAAALPAVQREALDAALAGGPAPGPIEPGAVLAGALGVLRAAATSRPVLLVVDDVQWVDEPSRLLVEFVARRCERLHLTVLVAGREDPDRPAPVATTMLEPLDRGASRRLLDEAGVTSPAVTQTVTSPR